MPKHAPLLFLHLATALQPSNPPQLALQPTKELTTHFPHLSSPDFQTHIEDILNQTHVPGLSIAVLQNNKTQAHGYGYAHLPTTSSSPNQGGIPVTNRTLFSAGSTTKSFTTALLSQLIYGRDSSHGSITWDTKIASLIREDFVLSDEYATEHVSLLDAVSHRTGLPSHDLAWVNGGNVTSARDLVRRLRDLPMGWEVRERWEYCNLMFIVVGYVVETVTGCGLGKLMKDRIWEPLGMRDIFFETEEALEDDRQSGGTGRMARGYIWDNDTETFAAVPWSSMPPSNGADGLVTTALDYITWIRVFLYPHNNSSPISPAAVKDMTTPRMPMPDAFVVASHPAYGQGLETGIYRGYTLIGHPGLNAGHEACMYWVPALEWGFVGLQNGYGIACAAVMYELLDDLLDHVGAMGGRTELLGPYRKVERRAAERVRNGREVVYPGASEVAPVAPSLGLEEYEGTYWHPAYQNITLCTVADGEEDSGRLLGAPLLLSGRGSTDGYLDMKWTFHHVSGEHWWVYFQLSPGWFGDDALVKARFEIDVTGQVGGLWWQAEGAIHAMAFFEKLE